MLPLLLSAALVTTSGAGPLDWRLADAPAPEAAQVTTGPDPRLAATLSVATPAAILVGLYATNFVLGTQHTGLPDPVNQVASVGFPLGFSAGYVYAGDPWRGALVGLGGTAVTGLGFGYLSSLGGGQASLNQAVIVAPLMLVTLIGYGWWVAQDAYRVADEKRSRPAAE